MRAARLGVMKGWPRSVMVGLMAVLWPGQVKADAPMRAAAVKRIESLNGQFFAVLDPKSRLTTVFKRTAGAEAKKLWEMPGWYRVAYLADDGEYLATGYEGSNLLERDFKPDETMIWFFKRGKLLRSVRLNELIRDPASLRKTVSHLHWGQYLGFVGTHRFVVETVERRTIAFDVRTGLPI